MPCLDWVSPMPLIWPFPITCPHLYDCFLTGSRSQHDLATTGKLAVKHLAREESLAGASGNRLCGNRPGVFRGGILYHCKMIPFWFLTTATVQGITKEIAPAALNMKTFQFQELIIIVKVGVCIIHRTRAEIRQSV